MFESPDHKLLRPSEQPGSPPGPRYTRPLNPGAVPVAPFVQQPGWSPSTPAPQNKQGKNKEKGIFKRAHNRYNRLSKRGKVLCVVLVFALLIPFTISLFEAINGIILYNQVEGGLTHMRAIATIFQGGTRDDYSRYFDVNKLRQAQTEMDAAHSSFVDLSDELDHDGSISLAGSLLPNQLTSLRKIGHIAVDGTAAGQHVIKTALILAPKLGPALKKSHDPNHPYLDQDSYNQVIDLVTTIIPLMHDMNHYSQGLSLTGLPLSGSQSQMISDILPQLPAVDNALSQVPQYKDAIAWLLGIGGVRTALLEPMDTAELRSTGGFTGQFGELTFTGGHMAPLAMKNLGAYEEDHSHLSGGSGPIDRNLFDNRVVGQVAPGLYRNWWPFDNFGIRDANVSADFPTSAKIILDRYRFEFQKNANGLILFTPQLIQQTLQVTGPIVIPLYNETVTAQNLNAKLHFYQLDNAGIGKEKILEHQPDGELARKLFTQRVTQQLMLSVIHLPLGKLVPMANQMLQAMKTKDLQIYFDNSQLEGLIKKYGSTAKMDRSNAYDGVFVVQSNDSGSKASQYVTTSIQDKITVDAQGNATHSMLMTLSYHQKGSVYGQDTYRDYVRVYVPENSTLVSGTGFSQPQVHCSDPYCQAPDVYNDGSLLCTPPVTIGTTIPYNDNLPAADYTLNEIGGPTNNTTSDEPGKGMFAGWVTVPNNCVMKVSLSWSVPSLGSHAYQMLLQAQGGLDVNENIAISDAACPGNSDLHYVKTIHGQNTMFSIQKKGVNCTLQNKPVW
ncbi:DUF4012 domain-containing protein [Dictyobacter vulcani]|uniref:DUF4012 domain-containing protein n=1 Tax=Dictyobacter vulcani TaxID=2607529 RepID=UPI0012507356|nr:DUF4012 domain-containing protein [Dictyobacter vulcani]